jgi:outer membrane protein OmpA-like peptidoglycan-associated protein
MFEGKAIRSKFKGYFYTEQGVPFLSGQYLPEDKKTIVHLYSGELIDASFTSDYNPEQYVTDDCLLFHNLSNVILEPSSNIELPEKLNLTFTQVILKNVNVVRSWEKDQRTYGVLEADFLGKVIKKSANGNVDGDTKYRNLFNTPIDFGGCLPKIWEFLKWFLLIALALYLLDRCEGCSNNKNYEDKKCCEVADSLKIRLDSLKLRNEKLLREKDDCNKENKKSKVEKEAHEATIDSLEEENKELKLKQKIGDYNNEIYFFGDEDRIREYSEKELDKIVKILKKFPDLKVSIEGYVNGTDPSKNPNLDQLRANRAKDLLINRGISVNRISAKGMGTKYIVDKDELFTAPDGTQYNRNMRAIIKIYEN